MPAESEAKQIRRERRYVSKAREGLRIQRAADAQSRIAGYAAVYYDGTPETEFELWPGTFERIMPGAFDRAIREDEVRGLFNHNVNQILGRTPKTLKLASDEHGLRYSIDVPDTTLGRDLVTSIDREDIAGSSFSFDVLKQTWTEEEGEIVRRMVEEVRLYDVGPVTFPAYEITTAVVRSALSDVARETFQAWCKRQLEITAEPERWRRYAARARAVEIAEHSS